MKIKRIIRKKGLRKTCFLFLFILGMVYSARPASAAIFIEQVNSKAPEVKAYVQGNMNAAATFRGKITGTDKNGNTSSIALVQEEETIPASKDTGAVKYIFLLDNSESVNDAQFQSVKDCLSDFRKKLSKRTQDKMSVYTVGVKSANQKCETVLDGVSGGKLKGDIKKIRAIKRNGKKTVLYRTINEITSRTKSLKERIVMIILTDGEDDSVGSRNNPSTTFSNVKNAQIPVYGILLNYGLSGSGDKAKIAVTKKILNTEGNNDRMVRGIDISHNSSASIVEKSFLNLIERIQEKTYLVTLKADSNRTLTNTRLTLIKTNGTKEEAKIKEFRYSDYVPDHNPPKVAELTAEAENQISIIISDENGLDRPSLVNQANYKVFPVKDGLSSGDGISIKKAEIPSAEDGKKKKKVLLTLERGLENGDYMLKLSGLKDASEEENIIDQLEINFGMDKGTHEKTETSEEVTETTSGKTEDFPYMFIVILALFLIIVVLIILLVKKKKPKEVPMVSYQEARQADNCMITLNVTDGRGVTKDLQWDVEGSFFVGRSEICEVFFDDEMLSKQHFVIEVTKQGCFIEDLSSTNGTCVNGNRIKGRVEIFEGDEILAGRERFLVQAFRKEFDPIGTTSPV